MRGPQNIATIPHDRFHMIHKHTNKDFKEGQSCVMARIRLHAHLGRSLSVHSHFRFDIQPVSNL